MRGEPVGWLLLTLKGELSLYEIERLKGTLLENDLAAHRTVIVDLADVRFIDSAGLEFLVLLHRTLRETGGQVRIVCPGLNLRKVFLITQLDRELEIHTSLEHALW